MWLVDQGLLFSVEDLVKQRKTLSFPGHDLEGEIFLSSAADENKNSIPDGAKPNKLQLIKHVQPYFTR